MEDRRVGHASGGHLFLDENADVEGWTTDAETHGDRPEVIEGATAPTWRERLESAGVTPFVRRHRAAVAGTLAVLALAVGGSSWAVVSRPPPDDGSVAVTLDPVPRVGVTEGGDPVDDVGLRFALRLTPGRDTDVLRPIALVGPGVRASAVHVRAAQPAGRPLVVDVAVVGGCDDPRTAMSTLADYGLRVARTDAYGRTVVGIVPLADTGIDVDSTLAQPCAAGLFRGALSTVSVRARAGELARTVDVVVVVRSSSSYAIEVSSTAGGSEDGSVARLPTDDQVVPAGATASIRVPLFVRECAAPTLAPVLVDDGSGATVPRPGLAMWASVGVPGSDQSRYGEVDLTWSAAGDAEIQAALRQVCAR